MNPKDVEKIEYYDVPTGKYMNDISAINFVMKQHESGGYVSFNADQKIGYLSGDYNVVAKLSKKLWIILCLPDFLKGNIVN